MIPTVIYISLYLVLLILFFSKKERTSQFKKNIVTIHFLLLLCVVTDTFFINLKGVLVDRLLVLSFLLTGTAIFTLCIKKLKLWEKLYFGLFVFYPIVIAVTFLLDRIVCLIIAAPLLFTLIIPETKFNNQNFELRESGGGLAPMQIVLIKKGILTEKYLGTSNDEELTGLRIAGLNVTEETKDSTVVVVKSGDKDYTITFRK